jgi:hypothetical protein
VKQNPSKTPQVKDTAIAAGTQHNDDGERLLQAFRELLEQHAGAFKQRRTYQRMVMLALGLIFALARHTVSQGILALGAGQADWSAWYRLFSRERFKQEDLDCTLLKEAVKEVRADEPFAVVVDGTQTPCSSLTLPGSSWLPSSRSPVYARGLHRARRWLTGAWLPAFNQGFSRAIPLRFLPAFTAKAANAAPADKRTEIQAAVLFLAWVRHGLDQLGRVSQKIIVLADGAFDTLDMWRTLPQNTTLIVRTAKNRVLHRLPGLQLGKGRKRLYGERAPTPQDVLHERSAWHSCHITVRGRLRRMRFRLRGALLRRGAPGIPVFLLVIGSERWTELPGQPGRRIRRKRYFERPEVFYLINAVQRDGVWQLPVPIQTILEWAWQRWEVEVAHRDMKAGFGVGQTQCWHARSAVASVQWTVWLYSVMLLSAYRAWGWVHPPALTCAWWRGSRRWSFNTVWRVLRTTLWKMPQFRALCIESDANTPKFPSHWLSLLDSVLAAARA